MTTAEYLRIIVKNKRGVLLVVVTTFILCYIITQLYNRKSSNEHTVLINFYLNPTKINNPQDYIAQDVTKQGVQKSDIDRFIVFGNSYELKKHLINKFDLVTYYNIDINEVEYLSNLLTSLGVTYSISYGENKLTVKCKDKDKDFAVQMAKEIIYKTNELSNQFLISGKTKQLQVCNTELDYYASKKSTVQDSILKIKYELISAGLKNHEYTQFQGDLSTIKFLKGKLDYALQNKGVKDSVYRSIKMEMAGYQHKYGFNNRKWLSILDVLADRIETINKLLEEQSQINQSIAYYNDLKRNIHMSIEFIKTDQPQLLSIESPNKKNKSSAYFIILSILIACYLGVMYVVVLIQLKKHRSYINLLLKK